MTLEDDVVYVGVLLASIAAGKLVRYIPADEGGKSFMRRRLASSLLGILLAYLVSGWHILHILAEILLNAAIILIIDTRWCHLVSLAVSFLYLFMFRLSDQIGLPSPPAHTNAIIMILTLKMVGLAFEVHDSHHSTATTTTGSSETAQQNQDTTRPAVVWQLERPPGFWEIFHYGFNHVGLITGPYYKYRTWAGLYQDPWNPAVSGQGEDRINRALRHRLQMVPFYVVAFLVSGRLFPLSFVEDEEWLSTTSLLYRIIYMVPVFFTFRMRIYSGFLLSECACISAGLGAFPAAAQPCPGQGPRRPEVLATLTPDQLEDINFETVHNIDEWGADFAPTMREALKCWNMTVQHWLVYVVYKRFPHKWLRTAAVMLMSSVWHGVYAGYYLSLLSVPLCLFVEDFYCAKIRARLGPTGQRVFDVAAWLVRMRWFEYLGMAFLLLRVDTTLAYWRGVHWVGHLSLPLIYLLTLLCASCLQLQRRQSASSSSSSTLKQD